MSHQRSPLVLQGCQRAKRPCSCPKVETASGYLSLLWDLAHGRATRGHRCLREGESLVRLWAAPFRVSQQVLLVLSSSSHSGRPGSGSWRTVLSRVTLE